MLKFLGRLGMAVLYTLVVVLTLLAIALLLPNPSFADAVSNLRASTVRVEQATGAIVFGDSGNRYILTNWHVCQMFRAKEKTLVAVYEDGRRVKGPIVLSDPTSDLCAASIKGNYPALHMADAVLAKEEVYTRGYPDGILHESHGQTKGRFTWNYVFPVELIGSCPEGSKINRYSNGTVRSCTFTWTNVLTNLYCRPGASGSPVLDDAGFLAGIISSQSADSNDYAGGVVPPEVVAAFLEKL